MKYTLKLQREVSCNPSEMTQSFSIWQMLHIWEAILRRLCQARHPSLVQGQIWKISRGQFYKNFYNSKKIYKAGTIDFQKSFDYVNTQV